MLLHSICIFFSLNAWYRLIYCLWTATKSTISNEREPKSCLGRVFNSRLGRIGSIHSNGIFLSCKLCPGLAIVCARLKLWPHFFAVVKTVEKWCQSAVGWVVFICLISTPSSWIAYWGELLSLSVWATIKTCILFLLF